ncbi:TPA: hypothetical protein ACT192_001467 [Klebsiella oxytoca]
MDTANRLWPSLQHNNLTLLSRLLNLAAENAELFFTRRRHSRSERRRILQRAVAHAFMQPEWQHLKKLHHGEIDLFISRGLATGDVIRYLRETAEVCLRMSAIDLPCFSCALDELRHQGFTIDSRLPERRCLLTQTAFLRFSPAGQLTQPLDILAGHDEEALRCVRRTFTNNGFQVIQRGTPARRLTQLHIGSDSLSEDIWAWHHCHTQRHVHGDDAVFL